MSNPYKIDKAVPLKGFGDPYDRIRDTMIILEVGESFLCPKFEGRAMVTGAHTPLAPKKFVSREVLGTADVRIWRVE